MFDIQYSMLHESLKKEYSCSGDASHSLPMLPNDIAGMFAFADVELAAGRLTETQCLFWKVFVSIAFTLWLRCVVSLRIISAI